MKEKVRQQLVRLMNKIAQRYPSTDEPDVMTDIHVRVNQETGDVMVYDDDSQEITRVVIEQWIGNSEDEDTFYKTVTELLRQAISDSENASTLGLIMPYNYVLEDENGEHIEELHVVDTEDTIILGTPFMDGLSQELDDFMKHLMEE